MESEQVRNLIYFNLNFMFYLYELLKILNGVFKIFSGTCVHNPFEVIIIILSICISLSLLSSSSTSSISIASSLNLKVDLDKVDFENDFNTKDNLKSLNVNFFILFEIYLS
jgi:hypothetical protein